MSKSLDDVNEVETHVKNVSETECRNDNICEPTNFTKIIAIRSKKSINAESQRCSPTYSTKRRSREERRKMFDMPDRPSICNFENDVTSKTVVCRQEKGRERPRKKRFHPCDYSDSRKGEKEDRSRGYNYKCQRLKVPKNTVRDDYCWLCHEDAREYGQFCQSCLRIFHPKCYREYRAINKLPKSVNPKLDICTCKECVDIAKDRVNWNPERKKMLVTVLNHILTVMKCRYNEPYFWNPVKKRDPTYKERKTKIKYPMDLGTMLKKVNNQEYASVIEFNSDVRWVYHNCVVLNKSDHKLTTIASSILRDCKKEIEEVKTCFECYYNLATDQKTWLVKVCKKPHLLVWGKVSGFPPWPCKLIRITTNIQNKNLTVRYFGTQESSDLPVEDCHLYSKNMPLVPRANGKLPWKNKPKSWHRAQREITEHIKNLELVHGKFVFAPDNLLLDPNMIGQQWSLMFPHSLPVREKSMLNRRNDVAVSSDKKVDDTNKEDGKMQAMYTSSDGERHSISNGEITNSSTIKSPNSSERVVVIKKLNDSRISPNKRTSPDQLSRAAAKNLVINDCPLQQSGYVVRKCSTETGRSSKKKVEIKPEYLARYLSASNNESDFSKFLTNLAAATSKTIAPFPAKDSPKYTRPTCNKLNNNRADNSKYVSNREALVIYKNLSAGNSSDSPGSSDVSENENSTISRSEKRNILETENDKAGKLKFYKNNRESNSIEILNDGDNKVKKFKIDKNVEASYKSNISKNLIPGNDQIEKCKPRANLKSGEKLTIEKMSDFESLASEIITGQRIFKDISEKLDRRKNNVSLTLSSDNVNNNTPKGSNIENKCEKLESNCTSSDKNDKNVSSSDEAIPIKRMKQSEENATHSATCAVNNNINDEVKDNSKNSCAKSTILANESTSDIIHSVKTIANEFEDNGAASSTISENESPCENLKSLETNAQLFKDNTRDEGVEHTFLNIDFTCGNLMSLKSHDEKVKESTCNGNEKHAIPEKDYARGNLMSVESPDKKVKKNIKNCSAQSTNSENDPPGKNLKCIGNNDGLLECNTNNGSVEYTISEIDYTCGNLRSMKSPDEDIEENIKYSSAKSNACENLIRSINVEANDNAINNGCLLSTISESDKVRENLNTPKANTDADICEKLKHNDDNRKNDIIDCKGSDYEFETSGEFKGLNRDSDEFGFDVDFTDSCTYEFYNPDKSDASENYSIDGGVNDYGNDDDSVHDANVDNDGSISYGTVNDAANGNINDNDIGDVKIHEASNSSRNDVDNSDVGVPNATSGDVNVNGGNVNDGDGICDGSVNDATISNDDVIGDVRLHDAANIIDNDDDGINDVSSNDASNSEVNDDERTCSALTDNDEDNYAARGLSRSEMMMKEVEEMRIAIEIAEEKTLLFETIVAQRRVIRNHLLVTDIFPEVVCYDELVSNYGNMTMEMTETWLSYHQMEVAKAKKRVWCKSCSLNMVRYICCRCTFYCSHKCQNDDWSVHEKNCLRPTGEKMEIIDQ